MENDTRMSLLQRVRNPSDQDAWREFYDLYYPVLLAFVRSKGIEQSSDAEDIVQELLVGLTRRIANLDFDKSRGRFRTYLWQSAHHAIVSWFRKNARHQKIAGLDFDSKLQELEYESQADPDAAFVQMLRKRVLEKALTRLKLETVKETWDCFERHVLHRIPAVDVGTELGRTANSVYVNSNRVMVKLRALCAEYMEELGNELS